MAEIATDQVGKLTITPRARETRTPLFYLNRGRLFQFINDTTIFSVNVVNTTEEAPGVPEIPLQLVLSEKTGGISSGSWGWKGTMLVYQLGSNNNSGVYYDCMLPQGGHGVLTFLKG